MVRHQKTTLAILIATLLVVSSLIVVWPQQSPGSNPGVQAPSSSQSGGTPSFYGFSFPYTYSEPAVPSSVGVQGVAGPQVPLSSLGVQQAAGATGHLGPVGQSDPLSLSSPTASVSVLVYNGTAQPLSRSTDQGATVTFQNISLYRFYSSQTSHYGWANMSLPEGWYFLTIRQQGGSYVDFSQMIHVNSQSFSITRYRMPSSSTTAGPVNNGPSSTLNSGYLNLYAAGGYPASQVTVSVYNGSLSGSLLFSAASNYYGYVNYTGLSSSYTYYYSVQGYEQTATGTYAGFANATGSFSAGSSKNIALFGRTHWTASVSGQAPAQGYVSSITVSGGLTFTGGQVYLSAPFSTGSYWVHFVNTVVYLNSTVTYPNSPSLYFDNSTVILMSNVNPFGTVGSAAVRDYFNNSAVFFSTLNNTALVYTSGTMIGPWLSANARNSIFESVHVTYTNKGTLTGRYVDSEFYRFNMTATNPPNANAVGSASFVRVNLTNSNLAVASLSADNSRLNGLGYVNIGNTVYINQSYLNFSQWPGDISLGFQKLVLYHDTISTQMSQPGVLVSPGVLNMSYCFINETPPWPSLTGGGLTLSPGHAYYFNDYFLDYPNLTARLTMINSETGSYQQWRGITFGSPFMDMNYTMIYGTDSIGIFPPHYFQLNWSHVNFSAGWGDNEWEPFEWFAGVVTPLIPRGTFNNCSFFGYNYNSTIWWKQYNTSNEDGLGYFQNQNVPNPPSSMWGQIFINHSTAFNTGVGTGGAYVFGLAEGGIYSYLNNNLFLNDYRFINAGPVGLNGWRNGSYMQYPLGAQIKHSSGVMTLTGNYFLNLNNKTVPFESISGSDGQGVNGGITLTTGNRFFYMPTQLQSYLPVSTTPPKVPFNNNTSTWWLFPVNSYNRRLNPMYANYTYEIPIANGSPFSVSQFQSQYVFNSTVKQLDIYGPSSTPNTYAWLVEPDINTLSHRPVVSFANGFAGGIMPNFTWNGSSYQLAVEPNMTYIAASSSSASPVGMQFQVPVGLGELSVWMYNSTSGRNQLVKTVTESGSPSTVTVTYNPATMPLGAVFFTNSSAAYKVTFTETGLPAGTPWSISLSGIRTTTSTSSAVFEVSNGTYNFTIPPIAGYRLEPSTGSVNVAGAGTTVQVVWNITGYVVVFRENGLDGENWTVTLNGSTASTNSTSLLFTEPNGTYTYSIQPPSNYTLDNNSGNLTINGNNGYLNLTFVPSNSSTGTSPSPPPQPAPTPSPAPPPTGSQPPPSSPPPASSTYGGYTLLLMQLLAIGLAPSLVLSIYMGIYLFRNDRNDEGRPKK